MNVRTHYKGKTPTQEMVDEVERLKAGGEECFSRAKLRPQDEEWWTGVVSTILQMLRDEIRTASMIDSELIAEMSDSDYPYGVHNSDPFNPKRVEAQRKYVSEKRRKKRWVMVVGFLLRDANRILQEALLMGDSVIRSRHQILAFATAIAMVTGCASLDDRDDHNAALIDEA